MTWIKLLAYTLTILIAAYTILTNQFVDPFENSVINSLTVIYAICTMMFIQRLEDKDVE